MKPNHRFGPSRKVRRITIIITVHWVIIKWASEEGMPFQRTYAKLRAGSRNTAAWIPEGKMSWEHARILQQTGGEETIPLTAPEQSFVLAGVKCLFISFVYSLVAQNQLASLVFRVVRIVGMREGHLLWSPPFANLFEIIIEVLITHGYLIS